MEDGMARKIMQLRKQKGLTLEQVGDAVGVGKSTVRKWENGIIANMKRDKIAALAKVLGTSSSYLMGWEDTPNSGEPELTEEEKAMLEIFRLIPKPQQRAFLEMGRVYADSLRKG